MSCNQRKYKELNFRRKGNSSQYNPVFDIPQCSLVLLGVTIQSDCKFRAKANKRLHVLRALRKEQYSQAEIDDHLITSIVFPHFIYGLPVYGASEPGNNNNNNNIYLNTIYKIASELMWSCI